SCWGVDRVLPCKLSPSEKALCDPKPQRETGREGGSQHEPISIDTVLGLSSSDASADFHNETDSKKQKKNLVLDAVLPTDGQAQAKNYAQSDIKSIVSKTKLPLIQRTRPLADPSSGAEEKPIKPRR
ncbi:hypothetical protein L249_6495, partial [Ophiocordyceps polyrhachis-furcata BCC 54312]